MKLILLVILLLSNILYNLYFIIRNKGIPESFSNTSYLLQKWGLNYNWFTIFCIGNGVMLLPIWLMLSTTNTAFLAFLSCSGLIFVGTTPLYHQDFQHTIHWVSGILCVLCAVLWLVFNGFWVCVSIIAMLFILSIILNYKNCVYWIEIITLFTLLSELIVISI